MKNQTIEAIRQKLADNIDQKTLATGDRFFKEDVKLLGVKVPVVNRIAADAFKTIRGLPKSEIFEICEELWRSGIVEEGHVACNFSYALRRSYEPADFAVFERWVSRYVNNWATCDSLCNHSVGTLLEKFPDLVGELRRWASSDNRWMKRAAAVSLIVPGRRGLFLDEALGIADRLLEDPDDLVQKGYGWMLKAVSMSESFVKGTEAVRDRHLRAVFDFVMARRATMPRTALRYAIEKMPPEMRAEVMKR